MTRKYAPNDEWRASSSTTTTTTDDLSKLTKAQLLAELVKCRSSLRATRDHIDIQDQQHADRIRLVETMQRRENDDRQSQYNLHEALTFEQQRSETLFKTIQILIDK